MKLKAIDLPKLRNAEFIQFIRQTTQLISDNDPEALKILKQYNSLLEQLNSLETLHKQTLYSSLTTAIEELDEQRDNALIAIGLISEGYTYTTNVLVKNAAIRISNSIKNYGSPREIARLNYNAQTATLISLLNEWNNSPELLGAINSLSLINFKNELETANTNFDITYKQRTQEYAEATPETLRDIRLATVPIYYTLRDVLEAHQVIEPSDLGITVIQQLNALISQYNSLLTTRSTKKSDIDIS